MVETLEHVFIQWVHVKMFWADFQLDLKIYFGKEFLLKEHGLLLMFNNPNFSSNEQYVITLLTVLAAQQANMKDKHLEMMVCLCIR